MDGGLGPSAHRQWHFVGSRVLLGAALALLLAGCGVTGQRQQTTARVGTAPTATSIVATPTVVTAVHVLRTSSWPPNHIPPLEQTVTDAPKVQRLYDALQALPRNSPATWCPQDIGVAYQLAFYRDGTKVWWDIVDPGGCEAVMLASGERRWALNQDHFWQAFADALGVLQAALFQGPRSDGPFAPTPAPDQP